MVILPRITLNFIWDWSKALALGIVLFQNLFQSDNVGDDFQRIALLSLDPGSDDQTIINLASGLLKI